MDSDLEDSVSLGAVEEEIAPPTSRRRLQRLHRLDDAPARQPDWGGNDQHDESNADYWDEEDEYADQLHKGTIADDDEDQQSSEGAGGAYHSRGTAAILFQQQWRTSNLPNLVPRRAQRKMVLLGAICTPTPSACFEVHSACVCDARNKH